MASSPSSGSSFLNAYLDQCKTLSKTLVIKSATSAQTLNDYLVLAHGESAVDLGTPQSWKYYLNISGEYHFTDTLMTVTSLDTLEEITFTKQNLDVHQATRREYRYGTRYYYSLLQRYPKQGQLILGILNPVDKQTAIDAEDGSILGYPTDLVEPQERTLIMELEQHIKHHMGYWNNKNFGLSDTLYHTAYHATLYFTLLPRILNLRVKRCKTDEVHSFHVRQYLASHQAMDRYLPYMTLKQSLWLYRNIRYIERNAGTNETFDMLVQKILTDRRIPLAHYSIRQLSTFDSEYRPGVVARRTPVNTEFNTAETDLVTMEDLFEKEEKLIYGTPRYYEKESEKTISGAQNSNSSVIKSKDLESNMVDYNDAVPDPLEVVLLRHWVLMTASGNYDVVVNFKDPKNGVDYALKAIDAFIYFFYVYLRSNGIVVDEVPVYINHRERRLVKPTKQALMAVMASKYPDRESIAQELLDNQPNLSACFSIQSFYDQAYSQYEAHKYEWFKISNIHEMDKRGMVESMTTMFYDVQQHELVDTPQTIASWMAQNNIPEYDYNYEQAQDLQRAIFMAATGLVIDDTKRLSFIQRMMLNIMKTLGSYSVQYIQEINNSGIIPLNWPAVRIGDIVTDVSSYQHLKVPLDLDPKSQIFFDTELPVGAGIRAADISQVFDTLPLKTVLDLTVKGLDSQEVDLIMDFGHVEVMYPEYDDAVSSTSPYIGKEFYLAIPDEQKRLLQSIYD